MNTNIILTLTIIILASLAFLFRRTIFSQPEAAVLKRHLGIVAVDKNGQNIFILVPAGTELPNVYSNIFTNESDGQNKVEITLCQQHPEGIEIVTNIVEKIPPNEKSTVQVVVTLMIDKKKNLRVKTTIADTARVKEYGPFQLR